MSAIITDIASPFLFFLSDITYEELTQASAGKRHSPRNSIRQSDITYEELTHTTNSFAPRRI